MGQKMGTCEGLLEGGECKKDEQCAQGLLCSPDQNCSKCTSSQQCQASYKGYLCESKSGECKACADSVQCQQESIFRGKYCKLKSGKCDGDVSKCKDDGSKCKNHDACCSGNCDGFQVKTQFSKAHDGKCIGFAEGGPCIRARQCKDGLLCQNSLCSPCTSYEDCQHDYPGFPCVSGQCKSCQSTISPTMTCRNQFPDSVCHFETGKCTLNYPCNTSHGNDDCYFLGGAVALVCAQEDHVCKPCTKNQDCHRNGGSNPRYGTWHGIVCINRLCKPCKPGPEGTAQCRAGGYKDTDVCRTKFSGAGSECKS